MQFCFTIDAFVDDSGCLFQVLLLDPEASEVLFMSGDLYDSYQDAVDAINAFMQKTDDPSNFILLE